MYKATKFLMEWKFSWAIWSEVIKSVLYTVHGLEGTVGLEWLYQVKSDVICGDLDHK